MGETTIDSLAIQIETKAGNTAGGIDNLTARLKSLYSTVSANLGSLGKLNSALVNVKKTADSLKNINIKANLGGGTSKKPKASASVGDSGAGGDITTKALAKVESQAQSTATITDKLKVTLTEVDGISFSSVTDQIQKTEQALQAMIDKGVSAKNTLTTISTFGNKQETVTATQTSTGEINVSASEKSLFSLSGTLDKVNKKVADLGNVNLSNFSNQLKSIEKTNIDGKLGAVSDKLKGLGSVSLGNFSNQITPVVKDVDKFQNAVDKIKGSLPGLGNTGGTAFTKLTSSAKGLASGSLRTINKSLSLLNKGTKAFASGALSSFKHLTKRAGQLAIALVGVRGVFTGLRKAVSAYMSYDQTLNKQLQNDWAVLGSLLAPILERVIALFTTAVGYINAFVKALTGIDLVAKANSKALKNQGKEAKKAVNELGNLADFDDLHVINFDKGDSSGGGSDLTPLSVEGVDTSWMDEFIKKIKSNDWYGLGMEIGRKFNEGLRLIDFDWLIEKASEWGKNLGDLMNGLTDGIDWSLLGQSIAGGLNTLMAFVNTFFDTYNFSNLGKSLGEGLNAMVDGLNWEAVGQFFANKLEAFGQTLASFATTFDFKSLGANISTAINSWYDTIDWGTLTTGVSKGIQGIFDTLTATIDGVNFEDIAGDINEIFSNLDLKGVAESLSDTLLSALDGLSTLLSEVDWEELGKQIGDLLAGIDWIGILTKLITVIGNILVGLGGLLWGLIGPGLETLWTNFTDWLMSIPIVQQVVGIFSEAWEAIKAVWDIVQPYFAGVFDGIKAVLGPIIDQVVNIFSTAWESVKNVWNGVKAYFTMCFEIIKNIFSVVKNVFQGNFQGAWDAVKKIFSAVKSFFKSVIDSIVTVISTVVSFFKKTFQNAWNGVKAVFSGVKSFFTGIFNTIKNIFKTIGTTVGDAIGGAFRTVINTIIKFAENTINGFIKSINLAIKAINAIPGVEIKELKTLNIPKLKTGTNRIEKEGLYHLHKNEAVVPEKYNPAVGNQSYSEANRDMLAELRRINTTLENQEQTTIVNVNSRETANQTKRKDKRQTNIYGKTITA